MALAAEEVLKAQPPPQSPGAAASCPRNFPLEANEGPLSLPQARGFLCPQHVGCWLFLGAEMSGGRCVLPRALDTCLRSPQSSGAEGRGRRSGLPQTWCGMAGLGHSLLPEGLQASGHLVPAGLGPSVPHCHGQEGPPSEPTDVIRPPGESRRAGLSAGQWFRVMVVMLISEQCDPGPGCSATYPVTHAAAEALGAWQAGGPQATLPALQTETSWSAPQGAQQGPPCPVGPPGLTGHKSWPQTSPTWKPRMPGAPGGPCGPRAP